MSSYTLSHLRELEAESIHIFREVAAEFEKPVTVQGALEVLARAPGLDVVDDPGDNLYPLPLSVAEKDHCAVGRIRMDCALDNGLCFWVAGDQLLKGAALNAVQIAEALLRLK